MQLTEKQYDKSRLAHTSARRPIHAEKRKWHYNKLGSVLMDLYREFCTNVTIHAIQYIGTSKTLLGKIGWLIVFVLSIVCCGMFIQSSYEKWDSSPVIVSFDDTPMPIEQIPFPAVTVCPEDRINAEKMNFTADFLTHFHSNETLSEVRQDRLMAVLHICDEFFHNTYRRMYPRTSKDIVSFLQDVLIYNSVSCDSSDTKCILTGFSETLTAEGICFTFNGLSEADMFNEGVLHNQYKYLTQTKKAVNWSMEAGYAPGTPFETNPLRGTGYSLPLMLNLGRYAIDMEEFCTLTHRFKMILHSPDEYPLTFAKNLMISLDQRVEIAVRPEIITTSKELANYSPMRRQCFFNHERQLKFFRVYNQNNCELECITNHTLSECGCVKFYMPRSPETRVCSLAQNECANRAYRNLPTHHEDQLKSCNCMSACNSIKIETETSTSANDNFDALKLRLQTIGRTGYDWSEKNRVKHSSVSIFYKQAEFLSMRRGELFGLTDFVANCGGILGLCLGVSIVSLVELLYFCFARPLLLLKQTSCRNKKVVIVHVKDCDRY